jgi:hypothetical protein
VKRLAVLLALGSTLVLPAAAAGPAPVLGVERVFGVDRLAWFDPATLTTLPGRKVTLGQYNGPWAFSADRSRLAIAGQDVARLRLVNTRAMRVLGDVTLRGGGYVENVSWMSATRVLAVVQPAADDAVAVVVNPTEKRVVRRTRLPGMPYGGASFGGGIVLLLAPQDGFGPAVIAVVDADGRLRTVTLDRISVGGLQHQETSSFERRQPGLAVDPLGRRAFVVGADFAVAQVDLDSLALAYHGSVRSLSKNVNGPVRFARWLGGGVLAVSGIDYQGDEVGNAVGLRLIDTRDWSGRTVDPGVASFSLGDGLLVGTGPWGDAPRRYGVYDFNGTFRYSVETEGDQTFFLAGQYGYVCGGGQARVVAAATGAALPQTSGQCPWLLYGQSSS